MRRLGRQTNETLINNLSRSLELLDRINLVEKPQVTPTQQIIFNIVRTTEWTLPELPS